MFTSNPCMFYRDIRSSGIFKSASVFGLINDLFVQSLELISRSTQYGLETTTLLGPYGQEWLYP